MFTGIVEEVGVIRQIRRGAHSSVLTIGAETVLSDLKIGDSVAVNAVWYTVETPVPLLRYIVEKGSITIDGISLTVATVEQDRFSVSLIPHTAQVTILGEKGPGDTVNLETDIIGKYVEKLLQPAPEPTGSRGVTLEFLAENGF